MKTMSCPVEQPARSVQGQRWPWGWGWVYGSYFNRKWLSFKEFRDVMNKQPRHRVLGAQGAAGPAASSSGWSPRLMKSLGLQGDHFYTAHASGHIFCLLSSCYCPDAFCTVTSVWPFVLGKRYQILAPRIKISQRALRSAGNYAGSFILTFV